MITKRHVESLKVRMINAKSDYLELQKLFAQQQCPLEIGQTVKCCGYSYKGREMVITEILSPVWSHQGDWEVCGKIINKNGTVGERDATFTEVQWGEV